MTPSEEVAWLQRQYIKLTKKMQSGVAAKMATGVDQAHEGKHLRVGVNSAMVSDAAVVELLIAKGIITELEWWQALVRRMEKEVDGYEQDLSKILGKEIRLEVAGWTPDQDEG